MSKIKGILKTIYNLCVSDIMVILVFIYIGKTNKVTEYYWILFFFFLIQSISNYLGFILNKKNKELIKMQQKLIKKHELLLVMQERKNAKDTQ